ncbi:SAM-dependent methyltransferase [Sphingobium sp. 22B]|uniref:class I SAM-dependent methyltransferase n=1 Tax=unclassified Sphingobium TaxID=2611147 RepID=UPI0007833A07|nr:MULTISPECIES: class I SAM-dependent methyltransferase [unclassified Sphingobium]KXU30490.1 SAM-dependent methyltransferase [Sphingobium sp. AM]KYC30749.1 SAM-dependent methyltransferase [Sphingobium sp. 22B]OAP30048.1 SAM-dependent methyltransferase [Sphingobium sp. 20006FA]
MPIHEKSRGYETGAADYVGGRPGYPPEAAAWLRDVLGVGPGRTTLEVGAGTGKFIPLLRKCGGRIIAVEPIDAMRAQLIHDFGEVEALAGAADSIPLPDGSVDAIVCAQAFHWFATAAAVQEMRRVLVPGGRLGLIWNGRDESVAWVAQLSAIIDPWEGDTPRYRTGQWRSAFPAPGFAFVEERHARNRHVGSAEQVIVQRSLSVSFIAALAAGQREEVERQVRALIAHTPELANRAEIAFPYETSMFAYRKI